VVEEILRQQAAALFRVPSSASEGAMERVGRIEEPIGEYASTLPSDDFSRTGATGSTDDQGKPCRSRSAQRNLHPLRDKEGLLLVDQHAAHERRVFEKLKKSYDSATLECQPFLIPPTVGSPFGKQNDPEEDGRAFSLGITLEHFGGSTFMVRSVPNILVDVHWESFLREILPLLEEQGAVKGDQVVESLLSLMACHGAIRAGQRLSKEEMIALVEQLDEVEVPTNCPHRSACVQEAELL